MRKMDNSLPVDFRVFKFLARYRITPQTSTGRSPAELLLNRNPKMHLDLLRGNVEARVKQHQDRQIRDHVRSFLRSYIHSGRRSFHSL